MNNKVEKYHRANRYLDEVKEILSRAVKGEATQDELAKAEGAAYAASLLFNQLV